jgi:outer membrane protein OmpA-like peptidoglycan-associated protein
LTLSMLLSSGCAPKPVVAPPPPAPAPKQSLIALLPEPDGKPSAVTITNSAGSQTLSQPYEAVRIQRADTAPSAASVIGEAEVRRIFGDVLSALPTAEVVFVLYFGEGGETLLPESQARMPAILNAVRERRSTAISVTGHTDTTATPEFNYQLGLRRARNVASLLRADGVEEASLFVESHGESDPVVKTGRGVSESRNRRVEVIVR